MLLFLSNGTIKLQKVEKACLLSSLQSGRRLAGWKKVERTLAKCLFLPLSPDGTCSSVSTKSQLQGCPSGYSELWYRAHIYPYSDSAVAEEFAGNETEY
jgi:hypothetical protein